MRRSAHCDYYTQTSVSQSCPSFLSFLSGVCLKWWVSLRRFPNIRSRRVLMLPLSLSNSSMPRAKSSNTINSSFKCSVSVWTLKTSTLSPLEMDSLKRFFHNFCINGIKDDKGNKKWRKKEVILQISISFD